MSWNGLNLKLQFKYIFSSIMTDSKSILLTYYYVISYNACFFPSNETLKHICLKKYLNSGYKIVLSILSLIVIFS